MRTPLTMSALVVVVSTFVIHVMLDIVYRPWALSVAGGGMTLIVKRLVFDPRARQQ